MKILSARQQGIVELAKSQGHLEVECLGVQFSVTPQTICRDLNDLY